MAVNFDDYMNVPMSDMKRILLPDGHYFGNLGKSEPKESGNGKPMLHTQVKLTSAGDDIDAAALAGIDVNGKVLSTNAMLAEDFGRAQIGEMIKATGVPYDEAQGFGTVLPSTENMPVKVLVGSRLLDKNDPNSERVNEIKKFLPAV